MAYPGESRRTSAARFATTQWSVVLAAGHGRRAESSEALESLCRAYWRPIYAYLRRQGRGVHDAQDLTQGFFAKFLEKNHLEDVSPDRGRFRSYLLGALKHFLSNERDRLQAVKRGGGRAFVSLDVKAAESRYSVEPRDESTPERIFDRCWALELLDQVLSRLEDEYVKRENETLFAALKAFLIRDKRNVSYKQVSLALDMTEGAVKVAAHRMRQRYREILKDEVAKTLARPDEAEEEIRHLIAAVSR